VSVPGAGERQSSGIGEVAATIGENCYRQLFNELNDAAFVADAESGVIVEANRQAEMLLGRSRDEIVGMHQSKLHPPDKAGKYRAMFATHVKRRRTTDFDAQVIRKDGTVVPVSISASTVVVDGKRLIVGLFRDMTEPRRTEQALWRIEWLLAKSSERQSPPTKRKKLRKQRHDNNDGMGTNRIIANAVGEDILVDIVSDYLDLLDTTVAIYEKNGDYALGIVASGWCQLLDQASLSARDPADYGEALETGRWHCHESCWDQASRVCVETGRTVDIKCPGGIRLYALPIWAGGEIVGAIEFGYGDPPQDRQELRKIADTFGLDVKDLLQRAQTYASRPQFIIDTAKARLRTSARMIGAMVERKQAQDALRESEEFGSSLVRHSSYPTMAINPDTSIRYVNPALEKATGFSSAELVGRKAPYPFWPQETRDHISKYLSAARRQGPQMREEQLLTKDGRRFWVEITSIPIQRRGQLDYYFLNWVDISERKRAESAVRRHEGSLRALAVELARTEERERRRIATAIHDILGQLLASCKIKLGQLQDLVPPQAGKVANEIQELVDQAIEYTRAVTFELSPPVLHELGLQPALEWLADQIQKGHGIAVHLDIDERLTVLDEDLRVTLFQAVRELLNNAVKHADAQTVTIRACKQAEMIGLEVCDDGSGFDPTKLEAATGPGGGFGLFNVRERLKHMGGSLQIRSKPGEGTRIMLSVPLYYGGSVGY